MEQVSKQMKSKRDQSCILTMGDVEEIGTSEELADEGSELDEKHYSFHYDLENEFLGDENYDEEDNEEQDLYVLLAQKDKDLLLAAELGKALLEKNEELAQKYEKLQEEYSQQAEELEQEKYELRLKIERISGAHDSRVQELQADKQTLRQELCSLKSASLTDSAHKRKTFAGLTEENEKLHSELYQLKTNNEALSEELNNLKRQHLSKSFSIDDIQNQQIEIEELYEKISREEEERNSLRQSIEELENTKDILARDNEELRAKTQELKKNYEDIKSQLDDAEDKLSESKANNQHLQDQLDEMKIQASLDQASRGSLFSELSDMSGSLLDNDDICVKSERKTKENSQRRLPTVRSLNGSPRPLAASSSNKRPRQYFSVDSDEEDSDDTDLEYDENECEVDGLVTLRNTDFYAQLEKEQTTNAELKKEMIDAHNELVTFYDRLRRHTEKPSTEVKHLDPNREFQLGCLTSFVQNFKDVLDDIIRTHKPSLSRKNSGYAGSMVGSIHDDLKEQIRQLKEDLYEANMDMEHIEKEITIANKRINEKEAEINELKDKLQDQTDEIKHLKEERRRLVSKECDPNLVFDAVYQQAIKDKEEAIKREGETAITLEKCKREAARLDKQLMEAIQQKIELSEQLEEWQYDMASLIEEQVRKQMRTAASEQEEPRTRRKLFSNWNWSTSPTRSRKQAFSS